MWVIQHLEANIFSVTDIHQNKDQDIRLHVDR